MTTVSIFAGTLSCAAKSQHASAPSLQRSVEQWIHIAEETCRWAHQASFFLYKAATWRDAKQSQDPAACVKDTF